MQIETKKGPTIGMPPNAHCTGIEIEKVTLDEHDMDVLLSLTPHELYDQIQTLYDRMTGKWK
jgi:hypothetical protein